MCNILSSCHGLKSSIIARVVSFCVLFSLLVCLSACTSVNRKVGAAFALDTDLKISFLVEDSINPDESEQSSPVFVRMYELSSTKGFEKADFIDLYERDEEILGDSFVAKQELERLVPGTDRNEVFVLNKDTRYVALFAEFFRYKGAEAKVVFPVTTTNVVRNSVKVRVSGNTLEVVKR